MLPITLHCSDNATRHGYRAPCHLPVPVQPDFELSIISHLHLNHLPHVDIIVVLHLHVHALTEVQASETVQLFL